VGERITVGPPSAWFHDELWLAYGALDGTLVVRSVNVRHNPEVTMRHTAGVAAGETVSPADCRCCSERRAIKVLPDPFATDTERVARFTREAQTLASYTTSTLHTFTIWKKAAAFAR
jgi:hypothetical protein